jgi:hypothetical protein
MCIIRGIYTGSTYVDIVLDFSQVLRLGKALARWGQRATCLVQIGKYLRKQHDAVLARVLDAVSFLGLCMRYRKSMS